MLGVREATSACARAARAAPSRRARRLETAQERGGPRSSRAAVRSALSVVLGVFIRKLNPHDFAVIKWRNRGPRPTPPPPSRRCYTQLRNLAGAASRRPNARLDTSLYSIMSHPCRLTLDVIMENFWTRPSGVYRKPVWLRPNVLQLFYDDDNDGLKTFSGPAVPGGHSAFTGTASVYSQTLHKADLSLDSPNPVTNALRKEVTANLQRVGSCYLVQANLLGFAGSESGVVSEQIVLSASLKWALSDYATRFGKQPEQIVLHLDVNGTLALGDLAGSKSFAKMTQSLAKDLLADEKMSLTAEQKKALADAQEKEETELRTRFTANYSRQDFIRAIVLALSALAPSAIRELDRELSGDFAANFRTKSAAQAFSDAAAALESPALTLAIRTNGTEHRQAAVYVQRLIHCVLGTELSEERGTIRRYVTCHEDAARGLFYHPVLLEQLHKSNGEYTYEHYAADVNKLYEKEVTTAGAFEQISSGSLKKSDTKFKVYLGLCKGPDDKPASSSSDPPKLDVAFKEETWLMPGEAQGLSLQGAGARCGPTVVGRLCGG